MIGLGELESREEDFRRRKINVYAISIDATEDASFVAELFPSLTVIADPDRKILKAFDVIHESSAQNGGDTAAPTTTLVDRAGTIRWIHRPADLFSRYPAHSLLDTLDTALELN